VLYQLERQPGKKLFQQPVYSDRYLLFLVTELKPYIDTNFPVYPDPANTFVMGSSMGGLLSMYA
jgi:predicted alpha/beta superfamily hydrolase